MPRSPDEILLDFNSLIRGHSKLTEAHTVLWEIIDDVRSSYRLAMENCGTVPITPEAVDEVQDAVLDYLTNHYGDD